MPKRTRKRDTGQIAQELLDRMAENNAQARGFGLSPRDVKRLKAEVEQRGGGKAQRPSRREALVVDRLGRIARALRAAAPAMLIAVLIMR